MVLTENVRGLVDGGLPIHSVVTGNARGVTSELFPATRRDEEIESRFRRKARSVPRGGRFGVQCGASDYLLNKSFHNRIILISLSVPLEIIKDSAPLYCVL